MRTAFALLFMILCATSVWAAGDLAANPATSVLTFSNLAVLQSGSFTVQNNGLTDIIVNNLQILGFSSPKYSIPSNRLSFNATTPFTLAPGGTKTIRLSVNLANTNAFRQAYYGMINATSSTIGSYAQHSVTINVTQTITTTKLSAVSMFVTTGSSNTANLEVNNTGNVDIPSVSLTSSNLVFGTNTISAAQVAFAENPVTNLNYGTFKNITVTVTAGASQPSGTYTGTITSGTGATAAISVTVSNPLTQMQFNQTKLEFTQQPGKAFSETVFVKNTGGTTATNLKPRVSGLERFNLTFSPAGYITLASGQQQLYTITGKVPESIDARDKATPYQGTVFLNNTNVRGSIDVYITPATMFDIRAFYWNNGESKQYVNGDSVEDVKSGENTTVDGRIRNLFGDAVTIEDIKVTITVKDIDPVDGDIEEIARLGDIDSGNEENFEFNIPIPYNTENEDYHVTIKVEGKDERGSKYDLEWNLNLNVRRQPRDIQIIRAKLDKTEITCDNRVNLDVEIENVGRDTEDQVVLQIQNSQLGINFREDQLDLNNDPKSDGSRFRSDYDLLIPASVNPGTYNIGINTFYDDTRLSRSASVKLVVGACGSATTTTITTIKPTTTTFFPKSTTTIGATTTTIAGQPSGQVPGPDRWQKPNVTTWLEDSTFNSTTIYLLLLIAAAVVLIVMIGYLAFMLK